MDTSIDPQQAQLERKPTVLEWTPRDDLSGSFDSDNLRFRLVPETVKGGWLLLDFQTTDTDGTYPWFRHFWLKVDAQNWAECCIDGEQE